jgi:hypothetical protein
MHMKSRITLTIEPSVSHRAKAVARERGTSLSGLVEQLLARETGVPAAKEGSFSARWAGRMKLADKNDRRFDALKRKYAL